MQFYLYALCPMFFVHDHTNCAQYVPVYMITLKNWSDMYNQYANQTNL